MVTHTAHLIYNPHAGYGTDRARFRRVIDVWQRRGWRLTLRPTAYKGHATELARAAAQEGVSLVLAAGGDGTLNEVANGLVHTNTIMAPLPLGTANSFAKELNMPLPDRLLPGRLFEAAESLAEGKVARMDVGCAGNRSWLLWAGAGADSYVVHRVEPRTKLFKQLGPAGYAAKAFSLLPSFQGMRATVTVDDYAVSDDFVMVTVSNCRLFGGGEFRVSPNAILDDGRFEVWLFRGKDWADVLQHLWKVSWETHIHDRDVIMLRGRHVTIDADPVMPVQVDGELLGHTPFACQILPGALRVLVPESAPKGLFTRVGRRLDEAVSHPRDKP